MICRINNRGYYTSCETYKMKLDLEKKAMKQIIKRTGYSFVEDF